MAYLNEIALQTLIGKIKSGMQTIPYTTTAPTAANSNGGLKIVVLSALPSTCYSGYLYLITR